MNSSKKALVTVLAVIVIGVGGVLAFAIDRQISSGTSDQAETAMHHHEESDTTMPSAADAVHADTVEIKDFAFSPANITVKVGTRVTWTNQDSVEHTVTSDDGAPAKIDSPLFGKGQSFSYTFKKAGMYDYHCQPHPYMKGMVTVTD